LLWQQLQSQENRADLQRRLEDQDARHGLAERRFNARNADLSRQVAALESEIDGLLTAQGELAKIEERRREANGQLLTMEAKKNAVEVATATLALHYEVMKSRYTPSKVAGLRERQTRSLSKAPATDVRRNISSVSSQPPATHAFREGLYAFASLEVSEPESEGEGGMSITRQAVHAKSVDDRSTSATARSIKAAFKRADVAPPSLSGTDWADSQFELGQALAAEGRRRSGTRELKEAVLAFRAIVGEWSRETAPLKWAMVQIELGRTLALLSRRGGDPSVQSESIVALGNALDVLVRAGESSLADDARRLLDEMVQADNPDTGAS
jgi:hypothetical protein